MEALRCRRGRRFISLDDMPVSQHCPVSVPVRSSALAHFQAGGRAKCKPRIAVTLFVMSSKEFVEWGSITGPVREAEACDESLTLTDVQYYYGPR